MVPRRRVLASLTLLLAVGQAGTERSQAAGLPARPPPPVRLRPRILCPEGRDRKYIEKGFPSP